MPCFIYFKSTFALKIGILMLIFISFADLPLTFHVRDATLFHVICLGVLCPETEKRGKMTMKSMADRIKCDDAKAASAAFVRMYSRRSCPRGKEAL